MAPAGACRPPWLTARRITARVTSKTAPSRAPAVLVGAGAPWDGPLLTTRQPFARHLASEPSLGPVAYLEYPTGPTVLLRGEAGRWLRPRQLVNGVERLRPRMWVPGVRRSTLAARAGQTAVARACARAVGERPVLWLFQPELWPWLAGVPRSGLVYHCLDDYAAAPHVPPALKRWEAEVLAEADAVVTSGASLVDHLREGAAGPVGHWPPVCEAGAFAGVAQGEPALARLPSPRFVFIGALDAYKVDFGLVAELAAATDGTVVLIGPVGLSDATGASELPAAPNIVRLGLMARAELPMAMAAADVAIIPYRLSRYVEGVFPLKLWEWFAAGKPVVSTPLPGVGPVAAGLLRQAPRDGFIAEALAAVADDGLVEQRRDMAARFSWRSRARAAAQLIENVTAGRAHDALPTLGLVE
jgi:hypothetical protein